MRGTVIVCVVLCLCTYSIRNHTHSAIKCITNRHDVSQHASLLAETETPFAGKKEFSQSQTPLVDVGIMGNVVLFRDYVKINCCQTYIWKKKPPDMSVNCLTVVLLINVSESSLAS